MPDVQLPDGTIVSNVPDTPEARQQLAAAWQAKQAGGGGGGAPAAAGAKPYPGPSALAKLLGMENDERATWDRMTKLQQESNARKAAQPPEQPPVPTPMPGSDSSLLDKAKYYGGLGVSAIGRGLASIPAAAADAGVALNEGRGGGVVEVGDAARLANSIGQQPNTTGEKYFSRGVEGATGAVLSPGSLARNAAVGATSGLGGEGAANLLGDTWYNRLLGSLIGGVTTGVATNLKTTRPALVKQATEGLSEADLQAARDRMAEIQSSGMGTVNASQAMGKPSALDAMVNALAVSPNGTNIQGQLRAQPAQVLAAGERSANALPGQLRTPMEAATGAQGAATGALNELKGQRSDLWKTTLDTETAKRVADLTAKRDAAQAAVAAKDATTPGYVSKGPIRQQLQKNLDEAQAALDGANIVPSGAVHDEIARLAGLAKTNPNTQLGGELTNLANRLIGPDGKPLTDPTQINGALKDYADSLKRPNLATGGIDAGTAKYMQGQVQTIRDSLGDAFGPIKAANSAFKQFTETRLNPVKGGPTGRIAGVAGYDPSKEAMAGRLQSIFDKGTVPGAPSEILTLEKQIRGQKAAPTAFTDAAKTWIKGKLSSAAEPVNNRVPDDVATTLVKTFGDPAQATATSQGTKDILVGMARANGLPEQSLLKGFQQMLTFASAAAKRPSQIGVTPKDVANAAAGGAQESLRDNLSSGLFGVRRKISDLRGRDAQQFIDRLLTTPEGMDTLIKLSKQPVMSPAAAATVSTFLGTAATDGASPE
jgi:hypothetical protein